MRLGTVVVVLLLVACRPAPLAPTASDACDPAGDLVLVDTRTHALWLCSEGRALGTFRVALGRGGVDKRREGDGRTPLGTYPLGPPRPSARFGTFIPIGYPDPEQRARGFTGRDVGIHGPERRAAWLGRASTWVDWTAGCVATGTADEIARVATFFRARKPRIVLR